MNLASIYAVIFSSEVIRSICKRVHVGLKSPDLTLQISVLLDLNGFMVVLL